MTPLERFETKVWKLACEPGCWIWMGELRPNGYGALKIDGRQVSTHRFSWETQHGPIPEGLCVLHRCDVKTCVRPDHLFLGTNDDNVADMIAKGRNAIGDRNGSRLHPERVPRGETHALSKLSDSQVQEIRAAVAAGTSWATLAKRFSVVKGTIGHVVRGRSYRPFPQARP